MFYSPFFSDLGLTQCNLQEVWNKHHPHHYHVLGITLPLATTITNIMRGIFVVSLFRAFPLLITEYHNTMKMVGLVLLMMLSHRYQLKKIDQNDDKKIGPTGARDDAS